MPIVEREYSRVTIDGETSTALIEYNDANDKILALILRGDINRRTLIGARGTGSGTANGNPRQPEIRLPLASQNLNMIPGDEGELKTPPGLIGVTEWIRPGR